MTVDTLGFGGGYDKYSDNELRNEVIEYYPELLDN